MCITFDEQKKIFQITEIGSQYNKLQNQLFYKLNEEKKYKSDIDLKIKQTTQKYQSSIQLIEQNQNLIQELLQGNENQQNQINNLENTIQNKSKECQYVRYENELKQQELTEKKDQLKQKETQLEKIKQNQKNFVNQITSKEKELEKIKKNQNFEFRYQNQVLKRLQQEIEELKLKNQDLIRQKNELEQLKQDQLKNQDLIRPKNELEQLKQNHSQNQINHQQNKYEILKQNLKQINEKQNIYTDNDLFDKKYEIVQYLGSGGQGTVLKIKLKDQQQNQQQYLAVKQIEYKEEYDLEEIKAYQKIKELDEKNRRYILCPIEYYQNQNKENNKKFISIILPLAECSLDDDIQKRINNNNNYYQPKDIYYYALCLFIGLYTLESIDMYHRDIKPQNLLLMKTGELLIADFGCAKIDHDIKSVTIQTGTWKYMPPELIKKNIIFKNENSEKKITNISQIQKPTKFDKIDVYQSGQTLFKAITLNKYNTPLYETDAQGLLKFNKQRLINNEIGIKKLKEENKYDLKFINLLEKCIDENPDKRPTNKESINILKDYI